MTANGKWTEQGRLLISYPYFDAASWHPLTCQRFWQSPVELFVRMCLLADLIHLRELVHCDLKLGNFLVRESETGPRLVLVDLDFLTAAGSSPGAKVFGSPDHIAPEILTNDRVLAQSDNYSLGVALKKCLESPGGSGAQSSEEVVERLWNLSESLTASEPLQRPYILLDALHKAQLLDSGGLDAANKKLFSMQLLPALRDVRRVAFDDAEDLKKRVIDPYRLLGMCHELISDLVEVHRRSPSSGIRIFKSLVSNSRLDRFGDFWRIAVDDEHLQSAFEDVGTYLSKGSRKPPVRGDTSRISSLMSDAARYRDAGRLNRAFLACRTALKELRASGHEAQEDEIAVLRQLGELARELNRLKDAAEYYGRLVDIGEARSCVELSDILELESALTDLGRYDEAYRFAEQGINHARAQSNLLYELMFRRAQAWIVAIRGEYDRAEEVLQSVLDTAARQGYHELEIRAHYTRGIIYWRKGLFAEAEEALARGLHVAEEHSLHAEAIRNLSALVMVCHQLAKYDKALQYGKLAVKYVPQTGGTNYLPFLAVNVAGAHSRLGESKKADYWLMQSLRAGSGGDCRHQLIVFHNVDGNIKRARGDYGGSEVAFHKALDLVDNTAHPRTVAKTYQCLADIAMCQGRDDLCRDYLKKAEEVLAVSRDEASQAELDLIGCCNEAYNADKKMDDILLTEIVDRLLKCNSRYFAVLGIFHLLVNAKIDSRKRVLEQVKPLMPLLQKSRVPLFEAVVALVNLDESVGSDRSAKVGALKATYLLLLNGNERFLAMLLCRHIAELYRSLANHKLASKFYDQARRLAAGIDNERMEQEIEKSLSDTTAASIDSSGMIESVLSISEVFKNIKDYRQSLEQVVKFAVDQTGAERGVLLLKSEQSGELSVAAFVNCDEDSLTDIRDFSSTIPLEVARSIDPLVIENALADKRTKNYKSIVVHNILSVICLPISIDNRVLGVLYLDHHTIPALFGKADVTYVSSIANLMAVMIETIRSYRDIAVINRQLVEDVSRAGSTQRFVTQDTSMLELFGKLPEIARTNAPVLIVGESGTGKEILCEMIHKLSLRSDKPLVKLNCAAIASTLIESELFGVAANVATDVKEREGKFAAADSGTLLLDEVGDMPVEVQGKVLRAVEYQHFEKVGSNKSLHTDIRFIYATNKDLASLVKRGEFRQDLLYRINTITIEIPPLRERRADIPPLVEHFISLFAAEGNAPNFSHRVMETLLTYDWPGNVRELKNFVERCCILYPRQKVEIQQLPAEIQGARTPDDGIKEAAALSEKDKIRRALIKHGWNQSRASAEVDIPLSTFRRKIKKYRITRSV